MLYEVITFVNKMISGDINEPLPVEAIASGTSTANPSYLSNKFLEAGIAGNFGWKYSKVMENLKKPIT